MAAIPCRTICQHCGINTSRTPWKYHQEPVTENKDAKVLWDIEIRTDIVTSARRTDIVVIDKIKRTATIIDITVPPNRDVNDKDDENI